MPRSAVLTETAGSLLAYGAGQLGTVGVANWLDLDNFAGAVENFGAAPGPAGVLNSYANLSGCRAKGTFSVDQYSEITIGGSLGGNDKVGLLLRSSTDASPAEDCYRVYLVEGTGIVVARVVNGTETALSGSPVTGPTWAVGDKLSAEVTGVGATVTLKVFRTPSGGSIGQIGSDFADTNAARILTGNPGICAAASGGTARITAIEVGDVTAGGGGSAIAAIAQANRRAAEWL